jgi:hypothetical protein
LGVTTYLVPAVSVGMTWLVLGEMPKALAFLGGALAASRSQWSLRRPPSSRTSHSRTSARPRARFPIFRFFGGAFGIVILAAVFAGHGGYASPHGFSTRFVAAVAVRRSPVGRRSGDRYRCSWRANHLGFGR